MIHRIFTQDFNVTKKATSRKCEGQLSSTKANSCSSYEDENCAEEMEQEDNNRCWANLPSIDHPAGDILLFAAQRSFNRLPGILQFFSFSFKAV